jgi:hypothetical protein
MKLHNHIKNKELSGFQDFLSIYEYIQPVNEMSNETFETIQKLGAKLGFQVKKSDSLFDYLKRAGKGVNDLFRTAVLFGMTDITDKKSRKDLVSDAKKTLSKVNKKEVAAFLMQLDRGTIGITGPIRHILMSFFGIELATYNQMKDDLTWLKDEAKLIKRKLSKMGMVKSEEMELIKKFENLIKVEME